jgi:hypothetical protein
MASVLNGEGAMSHRCKRWYTVPMTGLMELRVEVCAVLDRYKACALLAVTPLLTRCGTNLRDEFSFPSLMGPVR